MKLLGVIEQFRKILYWIKSVTVPCLVSEVKRCTERLNKDRGVLKRRIYATLGNYQPDVMRMMINSLPIVCCFDRHLLINRNVIVWRLAGEDVKGLQITSKIIFEVFL